MQFLMLEGRKQYVITIASEAETFEKSKDLLEEIARTFRVLE